MIHTQSFERKRANSLTVLHRKICRIDTKVHQNCSPIDKHLSWNNFFLGKIIPMHKNMINYPKGQCRSLWLALPKHCSFWSQRQQPAAGLVTLAPPVSPWMIIWQMGQSACGVKLEGWFIFYHRFVVKNLNHCYCSSWIPQLRMSTLFWKKYLCWSNTVFFPPCLCASLSPWNKNSVVIFESKMWFLQFV